MKLFVGLNKFMGDKTMKKTTVKEIKKWFKTLEENRYKRTYNSDARRVAWMVNNEGVDLSEMPETMRKKWVKAEYKKERYMANKFLESMNQNESIEDKDKTNSSEKQSKI